jgi:hypothetical protein
MLKYLFTIFLSSFLLFLVQPLITKFILPWFGGGAAIWNVCLIFFQTTLLAGYFYSHLITTYLKKKSQFILHLTLLLVSLLSLPIIPSLIWKPVDSSNPTFKILGLLFVTIGLPYFLLSTTSPLIQVWFNKEYEKRSPYRLYSLSNVASLLSLLLYPVLFEPLLTLKTQIMLWSVVYVLFVGLTIFTIYKYFKIKEKPSQKITPGKSKKPSLKQNILWILYAACGSLMLLAITNQSTLDIPPVPFLWVLFLAIYLTSFILTFESDRWYKRAVIIPLFVIFLVISIFTKLTIEKLDLSFIIIIYSITLFLTTMVVHGELALSKPKPAYLTRFYLMSSLGGALGGIFVAIIAPLIFTKYVEMEIGMGLTFTLVAYSLFVFKHKLSVKLRKLKKIGLILITLAVLIFFFRMTQIKSRNLSYQSRNFYGVLAIRNFHVKNGSLKSLFHGRIIHGAQFKSKKQASIPITYFGYDSGIGLVFRNRKALFNDEMKISVLGLGIGTLAAYGTPNDWMHFYEINPDVVNYAQKHFTYLKDCKAPYKISIGDGRIQMEKEIKQGVKNFYDVIVIDAFSGDSVPMHLLTMEAMKIYLKLLKKDGVLAFHTSNKHLKIHTLIHNMAKKLKIHSIWMKTKANIEWGRFLNSWVLVSHKNLLKIKKIRSNSVPWPKMKNTIWTDNYGSLLQIVK